MKRKRICFVLRSYHKYRLGGAEIQTYFIARELYKRGWEVHYICDKKGKFYRQSDNGIILHTLKNYGTSHCFLNFFSLLKTLKEINPDIIYQRVKFAYTGIVALFAKFNKKKFVWASSSTKDCGEKKFTSFLKEYHASFSKRFLFEIEYHIHDCLCSYGTKNADFIVAQTEEQKDLLARNLDVKSIVIKNGHPVATILPKKENPPVVLWLSNLKRSKHAEIFIKLARQCKDLNCRFILAGHSSNKGYLEELLKQIEWVSNIKYIGRVAFVDSNELIGRASVLVNTSEYEGFPNTFIQAWMRETPTVSLNVDPDNVIKKNKLGFHSRTFEQMVKEIRFLIQNKEVRKEMGRNARKYAVKEHDIKKIIHKYIRLFERLINYNEDNG